MKKIDEKPEKCVKNGLISVKSEENWSRITKKIVENHRKLGKNSTEIRIDLYYVKKKISNHRKFNEKLTKMGISAEKWSKLWKKSVEKYWKLSKNLI